VSASGQPATLPDLYGAEDFRIAFAGFLRRRADAWRLRRRDLLVPLDFYLARRQITVHGLIGPELVDEFIREQAGEVVPPASFLTGEQTTIYLPLAMFPKRVLLDFSTEAAGGARVPLLTRRQGSDVTAVHLLNLLLTGRPTAIAQRRRIAARLVLEVVTGTKPASLTVRRKRWRAMWNRQHEDASASLARWFRDEANAFNESMSDAWRPLIGQLKDALQKHPIVNFKQVDADALLGDSEFDFASYTEIAAYATRFMLRVLSDRHPSLHMQDRRPDNERLRQRFDREVLPGIYALDQLVRSGGRSARDQGAVERELAESAVGWMAYLVAPVRVGIPFHFRSAETLPLERPGIVRRQAIRLWTAHDYRISPLDAQATHFEVATQDPELLIKTVKSSVVVRAEDGSTRHVQPTDFFLQEYTDSTSVVHYYTSSRRWQQPFRAIQRPVRLRIRYRLAGSLRFGYSTAAIAMTFVGIWSTSEWVFGRPSEAVKLILLTVEAAFVGLLVFLLTVQHRKPIVQGKTDPARFLFCLVIIAMVAGPAVWLIRGQPDPLPQLIPPAQTSPGGTTTTTRTAATTTKATTTTEVSRGGVRAPRPCVPRAPCQGGSTVDPPGATQPDPQGPCRQRTGARTRTPCLPRSS
jgi:hypothetical protein